MNNCFYDTLEPTPEPYPEEISRDTIEALGAVITGIANAVTKVPTVSPFVDLIRYLTNLRIAVDYGNQPKWPLDEVAATSDLPPSYGLMQVISLKFNLKDNIYKAENVGKVDIEYIKKKYRGPLKGR